MIGSGRGKTVQVEVRRKRVGGANVRPAQPNVPAPTAPVEEATPALDSQTQQGDDRLTAQERANRMKVLQEGLTKTKDANSDALADAAAPAEDNTAVEAVEILDPREARRSAELAELEKIEKQAVAQRQTETERLAAENAARQAKTRLQEPDVQAKGPVPIREDVPARGRRKTNESETPMRPAPVKRDSDRRRSGKMTISQALSDGDGRQRSLASVRRQREKARMRESQPQVKQVRDVVIPDMITVQELANRMAERAADVVKELMKQEIMATVTQTIDAETAELVTLEFIKFNVCQIQMLKKVCRARKIAKLICVPARLL
jgi:translation initiation factor IF-2